MSYWVNDSQEPEMIFVLEQTSEKKKKKKELELELSELELQLVYVDNKKNNLLYAAIVPFALLVCTFIVAVLCLENIFSMWLSYVLFLFDIYLLVKTVRAVVQLLLNFDIKTISELVCRYNIDTLTMKRAKTVERIRAIRFQIDALSVELNDLENQRNDMLGKQVNRE